MAANEILRPGAALGLYPERRDESPSEVRRLLDSIGHPPRSWFAARGVRRQRISALVSAQAPAKGMSEGELDAHAQGLRADLLRQGLSETLIARAFALVREVAQRTLGMRHFDTQLVGGWILMQGMLAEMDTGEGKTLTATLPTCTAALAGIPVHVITVNDYLAERDADAMGPIYNRFGLSVGRITAGMPPEQRRAAYACDVTYCTSKELAFDYLRDRIAMGTDRSRMQLELERLHAANARMGKLLLRGLCFAIVDEADSVLIDEARTPLIIARPGCNRELEKTLRHALLLSEDMQAGQEFVVDTRTREVRMTERGRTELDKISKGLGGVWSGPRRRELLISQAISARHLFLRDRHYLVGDDKVQIIDENTGRLMPDRAWERGLHQMIEVKEGCTVTGEQETLARTTYQHFFRRYLRLSGMTGTAREVAGELRSVYKLHVVRVPTNRPPRRSAHPQRTYPNAARKWDAIVARIRDLHKHGRPLLVGTRTVGESEELSAHLTAAGVAHEVLNARQHEREAELIALAGEPGAITVATNMAGRGTDILLGDGVAAAGGLHVIATERNESRRIDRQLFGRCGRQGDPGSYEVIVALDDDLPTRFCPRLLRSIARSLSQKGGTVPAWLGAWITWTSQRTVEREHRLARRQLLKSEGKLNEMLAFTGRSD